MRIALSLTHTEMRFARLWPEAELIPLLDDSFRADLEGRKADVEDDGTAFGADAQCDFHRGRQYAKRNLRVLRELHGSALRRKHLEAPRDRKRAPLTIFFLPASGAFGYCSKMLAEEIRSSIRAPFLDHLGNVFFVFLHDARACSQAGLHSLFPARLRDCRSNRRGNYCSRGSKGKDNA
jgi:hypothetical protein